jgi:hypothetical protein
MRNINFRLGGIAATVWAEMATLDRSLSWARDSSAPHPGGHTAVIITTLIAEESSGIHCGN